MMTDVNNNDSLNAADDDDDDDDLDSSLAEALAEAASLLSEDDDDGGNDDLEKTIQTMAATQRCAHPEHSHSFSKVTFSLGLSLRKCAGCNQNFQAVGVFGSTSAPQAATGETAAADTSIVKCMACGALAHRSCAFHSDPTTWTESCPVNGPLVRAVAETGLVADAEEEPEGYEYDMELTDSLEPNKKGDRNVKRNKSFVSNASSNESMATQELDEGEEGGFGGVLGTGALNLQDPTVEQDVAQNPSGVARLSISHILFPKRKDDENEERANESLPPQVEAVNPDGDLVQADDELPLTPSSRKRIWFGKSPKKNMSKDVGEEKFGENIAVESPAAPDKTTLEAEAMEENNHCNDANTVGRRGWFQRRQKGGDSIVDTAMDEPSPAPKRGFGLFSNRRTQTDSDPANKDDKIGTTNVNSMEAPVDDDLEEESARAVFSQFLEIEEEEEEKPVTAESARADFKEFLDVNDDDNEVDEKEEVEASKITSVEVNSIVDVSHQKQDNGGAANKGGEEPDAQAGDTKIIKVAETAQAENERKGLLGFGLFHRKKTAERASPEREARESGENAEAEKLEIKSGTGMIQNANRSAPTTPKSTRKPLSETSNRDAEVVSQGVQSLSSGEGETPSTPVTNSKPIFRLFSRRSEESATKLDPSEAHPEQIDEDVKGTVPQPSPRKRALLIKSLWTAKSDNDDPEGGNRRDDSNTEVPSTETIKETNDNEENQRRPSLLARVFSSGKNKTEVEADPDQAQGEVSEHSAAEESLEATSPRRFSLFSSKKVADINPKESLREYGEDEMEPGADTEKPSSRKFSLFGFKLTGKDSPPAEQDDASSQLQQSWASDEPPSHWTTATTAAFQNSTSVGEDESNEEEAGVVEPDSVPLHYANHPFASVSRALEDNIMALRSEDEVKPNDKEETNDDEPETASYSGTPLKPKSSLSLIVSPDSSQKSEPDDAALGEVKPLPVQESTLLKVASGTYEAVKATALAQKKMGMVTMAGGIAGGVAGLMFAGPAGAVMGVRYGRTAGALGVILEGSITVGVIVAGVAGGRFTAEKIQEQIEEQRVLTIGEQGIARKVMLVRPTIRIDPAWHGICAEAQRTSPSSRASAFSMFIATDALKHDRYEKTSDICQEDDISTEEKVLLLVSRVLSDKDSFPGHVYRCLMQSFKDRCKKRNELRGELAKNKEEFPHLFEGEAEDSVSMGDGLSLSLSPRARREDAHGVIKFITGTLLEVRPGLASTPEITETTATVVEALVFGEVYDLVYEEIAIEATEKDKNLIEKIDDFEYARLERTGMPLPTEGIVSKEAIKALRQLPETHAAVDKLRWCVVFLERLSDHFAARSSNTAMGADSLLKMVCQHIIAARIPNVNAEVAFLEEFARDEQLLRGKEGYALVTLQAALHFLNMSIDFERDIFGQEDEEENVPIEKSIDEKEDTVTSQIPSNNLQADPSIPPNMRAQEDGEAIPDPEAASITPSSDENIEAREEKKEDETVSEEDLL